MRTQGLASKLAASKRAAKVEEAGLHGPKQAFPQAAAKGLVCHREPSGLEYAMVSTQPGARP